MTAPPQPPQRRLRRSVAVVAAAALALAGVALAAPAGATPSTAPASATPKPTPHDTAGKKAAHPAKQSCAATTAKGTARCFALVRSDLRSLGRTVNPSVTPSGYGPVELQSAYALPSGAAGAGQTVAIVDAFDDPTAESDLAAYRAQYGLPECTTANGCFQKVNQNGQAAPLPPPDAGWAQEISLDLDMVSAACPLCHILLVESDDNFTDNLATAVDTAVAMGAKYVSNSYGASEDPSEVDFDAHYNHPGVVVTASTGDFGYGTSYPATAPGVTAVGGTSLVSDSSTRGWSESTWAGAGSGCSTVEPKPEFQHDPGCPGRAIADVSAVADPETGVAVYDTYQFQGWAVFGGTSASSPLIAATYALAGTPVAATDPASYPYQAPAGTLNDVTTGDNGSCDVSYLCTAGPGYDGPTGLGTPNGVGAFRLGPHGTVQGTVTDSSTHAPLPGAKVSAGDASTVSGADGSYTLSLPTGTYDVSAAKYGYRTVTHSGITIDDGTTVTQAFALAPVPNVALSGTVTDGSGHAWPLYARITVAGTPGGPVYSDPFTGHYQLDLPSRNTYEVTVTPVQPGYSPRTLTVKLGGSDVVKNVAMKVDPATCGAPGYTTKYVGIVEHFDSGIPSSWTVKDDNGSGGVWTSEDAGNRGNLTGGSGGFAIIDSDHLGSGNSQDTELITPVVDLTNDPAPVVGLASAYRPYTNSIADIDYTVDGGTTWTNVWHQTTDAQQGPLTVPLPGAAGQAAVQVRFHYVGTWAYYWEVDDVYVGHKACAKLPGGLVAGFTTDANTGAPLVGVKVSSDDAPADAAVSAATPEDAAQPDGLYWLFSSKTGTHPFTAAKSKYQSATKPVAVAANFVTRADFALEAGRVQVAPDSLAGTVTLGGSTSTSVTLTNTGKVAAHVKLAEQDGGFQIAGRPAAQVYAKDRGAPVRNVPGKYTPGKQRPVATVRPAAAAPADAPWQAIADYPTPISNNSASNNGGLIYSVGGFDGSNDVKALYVYDPSATSWTRLADMSEIREAPVSGWINGKLYVTGGWGSDGQPDGVTEVYDPGADSWATVAANPKPHAGSGVAVIGGQLYVVGGCSASACGSTDVEVYDPSSDSWSAGPAYPESTSWLACGGIDGTAYCAGGTSDAGSSASTFALDGGTWSPRADLPTDDWGAASSVANGQLLVSGGVINGSSVVTNQGWAFDPAAGAWTALPNSNNSFYRLGGACGFYKIGGSVSQSSPAHAQAEVLPGYDSCAEGGADVTWLSEEPVEFDLAPGASQTVQVTLDSSTLTQPGTYEATLLAGTDTPYPAPAIPVTFTVKPPKTWAKILGTVSGKPCSGAAVPIAGATVQIDTWAASYTLTTDKDGRYALWLDRRNNPLTVIAAKDGWAPQTRTVRVTPGAPLTSDFTLKPAKACG